MEFVKIVAFCVAAAIVYGVLHDQVTAHLCVEYFTIAHPPVFPTESPFLLAIGWGTIATWWVGLPLGLALAAVARLGSRRRLSLADLRPVIFRLLAVMAVGAALAGFIGWYLAAIPHGWAQVIPAPRHAVFAADVWAHLASYGLGILGGVFVVGATLWRRLAAASTTLDR